jgi:hypothetical protein
VLKIRINSSTQKFLIFCTLLFRMGHGSRHREGNDMPSQEQPVKRGRGRPPKLPPPGDRRTARLTLTSGELERLRQAVAALRQAGEADLSQAEFTRRAVLAEVDRVLGAAGPKPARKRKK